MVVGRVYIRLAVHLNALPRKDLGSPASGAVGGFKNAQDDRQGDELCGDSMDDRGLFRPRFPVRCISSMGSGISSVHRRSKPLTIASWASAHLLEDLVLDWYCTSRYPYRAYHDSASNPFDAPGAGCPLKEVSYCGCIHLPDLVRFLQFPGK